MSPKKPSTQRQKQKIVDLTQVESDIPKHSDNLPKSKKLQIVNKAKSKENINSDLETNEADNLQSKVQIESYQPNYPPSIELQNQQTYIKNQQNQINELLNHYESNESSLFAADKYQHKVLSHINIRPTSLRIYSIEPEVDPLVE
ncbi:27170_t:CDS:2 [Racocetra persica]|uniref:27170_t:CDS:1 n=1 Tax=Racocetra persica TaxID=160502 RepID=A0ACA9KHV8_9GLOM|nr:27170_t:CDS:2 [Racocetra persica]